MQLARAEADASATAAETAALRQARRTQLRPVTYNQVLGGTLTDLVRNAKVKFGWLILEPAPRQTP